MKQKAAAEIQPLFSPEEFALLVKLHVESIRRAIRQGRIRAIKVGPYWRITQPEAQRVMTEGLAA